ncbi:MAG: hypothetical protein AB7I25_14760 [Vicinamibacterales bacterium]
MGDAGEGLVDAEARIQERLDEIAEEKRARARKVVVDPARAREVASLKLARTDFERQMATTEHDARRRQLKAALEQVDKQIKALGG